MTDQRPDPGDPTASTDPTAASPDPMEVEAVADQPSGADAGLPRAASEDPSEAVVDEPDAEDDLDPDEDAGA